MSRVLPPSDSLWVSGLILVAVLVAMALAWHWGGQRALARETEQLERQLQLHRQALDQRIDRYRTLPQVLALDPELQAALAGPAIGPDRRAALNRRLEDANGVTRSSTLTLIDARGIALAASNWRLPSSNVGADYSFRPYVQQALREGRGQFYGIGKTTGEPGYFLSQAIRDSGGSIVGLVVIKIDLDALETEWLTSTDIVLVSDVHDVVFLASRPEWRYRTLRPLSSEDQRELAETQQYMGQALTPLRVSRPVATGAVAPVRVADPPLSAPVLWHSLVLPGEGWQLHLLHDASAIGAAARTSALAAGGGALALCFLALFVRQRQRTAALRQRSREALEAMLKQHARELRTAQDGVVEAARQADAGLSRSLEHLPQGVVIVDAALNLVAWNSRYQELFRFPPELLRVGQPIRDLFRHNAQRGLLGPGPLEEAIERRMQHLKSGKPHQRESEKDDGTVLEIRGNPLPDGGFVTSYADITSYRQAARELRSLADALERRIADRTRALDAARQEAENANRHKFRFVAAAVHDLLQPLNAARMFVAALRSGGRDLGEARSVVDSIDAALAAQDGILNGLLDIARLESGALKTRIRDFALGPLLAALANQSGIVASAAGLRLRALATRATVSSDADLLRRILQNFLANAIRYNRPGGRVLLGCRRRGIDHLRIEVHDQGPGIPAGQQQLIFEEFRRLDHGAADDRSPRGAGLGLAIVDRIGRLLGHRIGLRSRLGQGSVFFVEVPLGDPAAAAAHALPAASESGTDSTLNGVRVWCVDDEPAVCEATRALLERWCCEVDFAGDGAAAITRAAPGAAPQVLLLDLHLGACDGRALWPQLLNAWRAEHAPALIVITADRDPAIRAEAAARGWGHLTKPVRAPALRSLMSQLLLRRALP